MRAASEVVREGLVETDQAVCAALAAVASGTAVTTAPAHIDDASKSVLVLPLPALAPGSYRVMWRVLSVDTHVTEGSFRFQVAP